MVHGVVFEGNSVYTSDVLTKYMAIPEGQIMNSVYVGQKVQGINAAYARDGYMLAHVDGIAVDDNGMIHNSYRRRHRRRILYLLVIRKLVIKLSLVNSYKKQVNHSINSWFVVP